MTAKMTTLDKKIDRWLATNLDGMVEDAMELIRVRSVCQYNPVSPHPMGEGCAEVLDRMLDICRRQGFETRNYGYYAGTATLRGAGAGRIGIMVHLDTAAETDTWTIRPFSPYVKDGRLYGRGSSDNKGAAAAALYVMKCLRDLGIRLEASVELFFGCAKKSLMQDMDRYLEETDPPDFSLVADANFPVCVGEKGSFDGLLRCDVSGGSLVDFRGGRSFNAVPDQVFALLKDTSPEQVRRKLGNLDNFSVIPVGELVKISTTGIGGHAAFPENTKNPLPTLARALTGHGLVEGKAARALDFLAEVFSDYRGRQLDVDVQDAEYGCTTHAGGRVYVEDGQLVQALNLRYVPGLDAGAILERVGRRVAEHGFTLSQVSNTRPYKVSPEMEPVARMLGEVCNQVLGTRLSPYTMGGVTYAGCLPNAVGFGPNRSDITEGSVEGVGGGHSVDEYIHIQSLMDFVKIYVRSLGEMDRLIGGR